MVLVRAGQKGRAETMGIVAPRLMVAGTASGSGKTTVSCGLMRLLADSGMRVQACKVGPDYLDPTFHRRVLGVPSRNLDLFLGGPEVVRALVAKGSRKADITLIEGVMGYYDGSADSDEASSYDVARVTKTPVVLVVDARGRALSVAAEVAGFARFREHSQVAGVILNHVSEAYYPVLQKAVERETGIPVLGYVPRLPEAALPSRHLGLVSADEVNDVSERMDALANTMRSTLDIDALLGIAQSAEDLEVDVCQAPQACEGAPLIAVARDEAFSFYYEDTLDLLVQLGARLVSFSPLRDEALPDGACGLYLGGGYPELHAKELSRNASMRNAVRRAVSSGVPTIAECGGFLYLQQELEDEAGISWPMVGLLDGLASRGKGLEHFGYVTLTATRDGLLAREGERLRAHEFHHWRSTREGDAFHAQKPRSTRGWECVVATETLHAGFPHLYLCGNPQAARRFVAACSSFGASRKGVSG